MLQSLFGVHVALKHRRPVNRKPIIVAMCGIYVVLEVLRNRGKAARRTCVRIETARRLPVCMNHQHESSQSYACSFQYHLSPPALWGPLDFMIGCSSPPPLLVVLFLLLLSSTSTPPPPPVSSCRCSSFRFQGPTLRLCRYAISNVR